MKKLIDNEFDEKDEKTVICYDNPFFSIPRQEYEYDRRTQPRAEFAAQVHVSNGYQVIRTWTHDLSITGAALKEEIPTVFLNRKLEITLILPIDGSWRRLRFQAVMIGSYMPSCRLMYVGGFKDDLYLLNRFIEILKTA